ncbi:MAG: outer membrane protein assembly factor BamD [Candidatus Cloacimonadaceae bacterium]
MLKKCAWLLLLIILAGCARNKVDYTPETKMAKANELFAQKKYAKAAVLYEEISFEKKSATSAVALMRLADSYFNMNKFIDARLKYTMMTNSYPDYPDIETAFFRIGVCYYEESLPAQYDQTETAQSIEAFRIFIDKFPGSKYYPDALEYIRKAQNKIIEKKYYNGYIYYKMKDYSSALMYFKEIIMLGNQTEIDRRSLYYATRISLKHKNETDAYDFWNRLKTKYPNSRETKKLAKFFD